MSENISISARTTRLNSLILGRPGKKFSMKDVYAFCIQFPFIEALPEPQKEICMGINRDGLLDALFVLYDECNKDAVKKKSKNIQDFTSKCKPF